MRNVSETIGSLHFGSGSNEHREKCVVLCVKCSDLPERTLNAEKRFLRFRIYTSILHVCKIICLNKLCQINLQEFFYRF